MKYEFKCNKCGWEGTEDECIPCGCDECQTVYCPKCKSTDLDDEDE
jgi:hypothetical protein